MTTPNSSVTMPAAAIPALSHAEAGLMAQTELERFLALARSLSDKDCQQPTDCTLWTVHQIVAHQAGAYAGFASWGQFVRQWSQLLRKRQPGQLPVDLVNARQVVDRAHLTPAQLVAELETVGPQAIATRQRLPRWLRALRMPFGPPLGFARLDYLTDLIYTRDTWSHRLDICRATGREMHLTPGHDGRMLALVVRELAAQLDRETADQQPPIHVVYELTGPAGGAWRLGSATAGEPVATIRMDAPHFIRLTSGRLAPDAVQFGSLAEIEGDAGVANWVLDHSAVPY